VITVGACVAPKVFLSFPLILYNRRVLVYSSSSSLVYWILLCLYTVIRHDRHDLEHPQRRRRRSSCKAVGSPISLKLKVAVDREKETSRYRCECTLQDVEGLAQSGSPRRGWEAYSKKGWKPRNHKTPRPQHPNLNAQT
jgi:hypothetical protein